MSDDLPPMPEGFMREWEKPYRALMDDRRRAAYGLRMRHMTNEDIGYRLHADPSANTDPDQPGGFPGGYGWLRLARGQPPIAGTRLADVVQKDLRFGLRRSRLASEAVRQEALTLTLDQLDLAAEKLWPKVEAGNPRAQEVWLANMDRRITLLGLEPEHAIRVAVEGPKPQYGDPDFMPRFLAALRELGAVNGETTEEFRARLEPKAIEAVAEEAPG